MTYDQVRFFIAVVEHGGFQAAARSLAVSQPSVSAGIKKLEQEFGVVCHIVMVGSDSSNQLDEARRIMAEAVHDVVAARCQCEVDQAL